jgi:hypothetical protein
MLPELATGGSKTPNPGFGTPQGAVQRASRQSPTSLPSYRQPLHERRGNTRLSAASTGRSRGANRSLLTCRRRIDNYAQHRDLSLVTERCWPPQLGCWSGRAATIGS